MNVESENKSYDFYAFSTATLNDILGKYTKISIPKIAIGYICIVSVCLRLIDVFFKSLLQLIFLYSSFFMLLYH